MLEKLARKAHPAEAVRDEEGPPRLEKGRWGTEEQGWGRCRG